MLITSEAVGPCLDFFTVCGDQIVNTFSKCNNPFFMLYHYFEEKLLMLSKFSNSKKMGFQSLILNNTKSQYQYQGTLMIVYYLHSDKPSCCQILSKSRVLHWYTVAAYYVKFSNFNCRIQDHSTLLCSIMTKDN